MKIITVSRMGNVTDSSTVTSSKLDLYLRHNHCKIEDVANKDVMYVSIEARDSLSDLSNTLHSLAFTGLETEMIIINHNGIPSDLYRTTMGYLEESVLKPNDFECLTKSPMCSVYHKVDSKGSVDECEEPCHENAKKPIEVDNKVSKEEKENLSKPNDWNIKMEGEPQKFDGGAIRYTKNGKGRYDLMPGEVISELADIIDEIDIGYEGCSRMGIIDKLFMGQYADGIIDLMVYGMSGSKEEYCSVSSDVIPDYFLGMLEQLSKHYEKGAEKYGENNWKKGLPFKSFRDSGLRHTIQFLKNGNDNENHFIAAIWNFVNLLWLVYNRPELCGGEKYIDSYGNDWECVKYDDGKYCWYHEFGTDESQCPGFVKQTHTGITVCGDKAPNNTSTNGCPCKHIDDLECKQCMKHPDDNKNDNSRRNVKSDTVATCCCCLDHESFCPSCEFKTNCSIYINNKKDK